MFGRCSGIIASEEDKQRGRVVVVVVGRGGGGMYLPLLHSPHTMKIKKRINWHYTILAFTSFQQHPIHLPSPPFFFLFRCTPHLLFSKSSSCLRPSPPPPPLGIPFPSRSQTPPSLFFTFLSQESQRLSTTHNKKKAFLFHKPDYCQWALPIHERRDALPEGMTRAKGKKRLSGSI